MADDHHLGAAPGPPASIPSHAVAVAPDERSIPLPPLPTGVTTTGDDVRRQSDRALTDAALVLVLSVLAFLLASFPARNSDLFLHLGAGKLLAEGKYTFGVDPFASTTAGVYWVNTNWGFDLLAYEVYSWFPESGLVVLKALLVALTAAAMVLAGRSGRGWWLPVVTAGLAVVALAGRLPLGPACVSYLLLAVLFWLLERPHFATGSGSASVRSYWPVPLLFVLWVNLDGWFILGLVVLALYAVGEGVQAAVAERTRRPAGTPGTAAALAVVLALAVAGCLVSPHHFRVFTTLPADLGLSAAYGVMKQDEAFRWLVTSPFEAGYFRPQLGLSAAGLTYFVLIALGLFAFVLNYADLRWVHVLTWLFLLLLSAYQARLIPFFAVASGPILALNFQAWYVRQLAGAAPGERLERWSTTGRGLTLVVGLALAVAAWPGWLQAAPYEVRRWYVERDPGLAAASGQLKAWHDQGVFKEQNPGFILSLETAHQLAWLCPEERGFVDSRLPLFDADTAQDYLTVRAGLWGRDAGSDKSKPPAWREVLHKRHIDHLILHETDAGRMRTLLFQLARLDHEWPLLYLENGTAIFGWNDPADAGKTDRFAGLRLDLDRQAFHPADDLKAPRDWPGREPKPPEWYDAFDKPRPSRSTDREDAALYLDYFDSRRVATEAKEAVEWDASLAVSPLGFALGGDWPSAVTDVTLRSLFASGVRHTLREPIGPPIVTDDERVALKMRLNFLFSRDTGPAGPAFLAVRAARRAVHANPDDARAYFLLGEAYLRLTTDTSERASYSGLWRLERIRRAQAVTAYHQALILQPDLVPAHNRLATIFKAMGYGDLQLKHLRAEFKLIKAAGPNLGESNEKFNERLEPLQKQLGDQETAVQKSLDLFEVQTANFKVFERAELAANKGLPAKSLEILETSDVSAFGAKGMNLELELFLFTGRVREVREWMEPEHEELLGPERYGLIRLLLFTATGDYAAADAELEKMGAAAAQEAPDDHFSPIRGQVASIVAQTILGRAMDDLTPLGLYVGGDDVRIKRVRDTQNLVQGLRQQAEFAVIRALLAVEVGDADRAEALLTEYVEGLYVSSTAADAGAGLDFFGRPLGQRYLAVLRQSKRR